MNNYYLIGWQTLVNYSFPIVLNESEMNEDGITEFKKTCKAENHLEATLILTKEEF